MCLLSAALPLCVYEGCLGQLTGLSVIELWKMSDWLAGLGYGQLLMNYFCDIYYAVIMGRFSFLLCRFVVQLFIAVWEYSGGAAIDLKSVLAILHVFYFDTCSFFSDLHWDDKYLV